MYRDTLVPPLGRAILMMTSRPSSFWWTDWESFGKTRCKRIAKHYGGKADETCYGPEGWYHFRFKEFEDLMRFVYDRRTGRFVELFGDLPDGVLSHVHAPPAGIVAYICMHVKLPDARRSPPRAAVAYTAVPSP